MKRLNFKQIFMLITAIIALTASAQDSQSSIINRYKNDQANAGEASIVKFSY
jgi:hypothetical protein